MKTPIPSITTSLFGLFAAVSMTCAVNAEAPKNVKEALDIALENETIKASADKMKLYSVSATVHTGRNRFSFSFYDGGENVHEVLISRDGKVSYSEREKPKHWLIFDLLDFVALPAPREVFIEDIKSKSKNYLSAINFKPLDGGKVTFNYALRSDTPRQKDKPKHVWYVTIPIADGKGDKMVTFANGELEEIRDATR